MAPQISFERLFAGGRPVFPAAVQFGLLVRELAAWMSTQQHPGHGVTPAAVHAAFRQAEMGDPSTQCDLFDDMVEGDAHARNLFEQRNQAVAGKPSVIQAGEPAPEAEQAARVLREAFRRLNHTEGREHLLSFNKYGYAACEIEWGLMEFEGRSWVVPVWLHPVEARRFRIGERDELRIYVDVKRPKGDELKPGKWIVLRRTGTKIARAGLMRTGIWPMLGKRYGFRDAVIFSEKFGLPFPVVQYATEVDQYTPDDASLAIATEILKSIGNDSGAALPKGLEIKFAEVGQNGDSSRVHGALISLANRETSKLVNGSTLANDNSDSGGASYALGEVHDSVRWEAVQYDAEKLQVAEEQQIFAAFCVFNGLRALAIESRIQVVRNLEPGARIELASKLVNDLGVPVSISQLRSDTGFRAPTNEADSAPGRSLAAAAPEVKVAA